MEFRGVKGRSEDENQKTEKDQAVHDAGIKILECLDLEQTIPQEELDPFIFCCPSGFQACPWRSTSATAGKRRKQRWPWLQR